MLSTLHIENIAVIEQAEISFDRGFNVLTGETGAGKSIVIDAISAILGERASREMIRTGAQKAFVSAIFTGVPELPWFAENQVPYEPELGISREIFADGKNSCRVGGKPVTVSTLRRLGVQLIQIHGQNDSQQLFDEATHIGYLDLFANDEALLESYRQAYDKVSAVRQEIRRLSMDESEKLRLVETLKFQIDEIERAELQPGEEEELLERRKVLQNAEKLTDAIESAVAALYGDESSDGASAMIANAAHALEKVSRVSDEMRALSGKLNDLMYTAQDIADELRDKKDDLTYSADELEQIEERLDTLHKLKRKYGGSVEDVLAFLEKSKRQLDEVEFATDRIEQLQKKLSGLQKTLLEQGTALTEARKVAAQRLQREISSELMQLDMPKIRFVCEFFDERRKRPGRRPLPDVRQRRRGAAAAVEGRLRRRAGAHHAGNEKRAGGGGFRRDHDLRRGRRGRQRPGGQKVTPSWTVAKGRQVLCVTHLPQIAAMADTEFTVEKRVENERTYTSVLRAGRNWAQAGPGPPHWRQHDHRNDAGRCGRAAAPGGTDKEGNLT